MNDILDTLTLRAKCMHVLYCLNWGTLTLSVECREGARLWLGLTIINAL